MDHEHMHSDTDVALIRDIEQVVKTVEKRTNDWLTARNALAQQLTMIHSTVVALMTKLGAQPVVDLDVPTRVQSDAGAIDLTPRHRTNGTGKRRVHAGGNKHVVRKKLHWTQRPENKSKLAQVLRKAMKTRHGSSARA